jgi:hypothetical protein
MAALAILLQDWKYILIKGGRSARRQGEKNRYESKQANPFGHFIPLLVRTSPYIT